MASINTGPWFAMALAKARWNASAEVTRIAGTPMPLDISTQSISGFERSNIDRVFGVA